MGILPSYSCSNLRFVFNSIAKGQNRMLHIFQKMYFLCCFWINLGKSFAVITYYHRILHMIVPLLYPLEEEQILLLSWELSAIGITNNSVIFCIIGFSIPSRGCCEAVYNTLLISWMSLTLHKFELTKSAVFYSYT